MRTSKPGSVDWIRVLGATAVVLLLFGGRSAQAADAYHMRMSGEQLVRDMMADPRAGQNLIQRERAMGYIDGVMESTVNTSWCPAGKSVPHELHYVVTEDIANMNAQRRAQRAAVLVAAVLANHFPCKQPRVKR